MCKNIRSEDVHYVDQYGGRLIYDVIEHDKQLCKEFIVTSHRFPFRKWFLSTVVLNVAGLFFNLHHQSSWLMSALIILLILAIAYRLHNKVKQESLLVMASLGIQLTTKFASGRTVETFYQVHQVSDIVINEAITMQRVMFYLTILLRDSQTGDIGKLIPLFQQTWPSVRCLTHMYRGIHSVMDFDRS